MAHKKLIPPNAEEDNDQWCPARDLAKQWKVHPKTIGRWAEDGIIPPPRKLKKNVYRYNMRTCNEALRALYNRQQQETQGNG